MHSKLSQFEYTVFSSVITGEHKLKDLMLKKQYQVKVGLMLLQFLDYEFG